MKLSLFVDQFDNVCEAAYAEIADEALGDVVDKYNLITDNRGHEYFTQSNEYAAAVADEISIPEGDAKTLYFLAQDHLRRTGGYDNPADAI